MVCPFAHLLGQGQQTTCPFSSKMLPSTSSSIQAATDGALSLSAPCFQTGQQAVASPSSSCEDATTVCGDVTSSIDDVSSSSTSGSSSCVYQAWQMKRPVLDHDPKLTRRQLRKLNRNWSLSDVAQHKYCDDGWIAVDGKVYDITEHIATHPGWDSGCRVTEVLSILAHLGCDCSQEFHEIHRAYPVSYKQLAAYYIGDLEPSL